MNNMFSILSSFMQMGNNPQAIAQQLINQNPQIQVILNQMRQSGMTPQQYAQQLARQNGLDLRQVTNFFNQKGIRL